MKLRQFVWLLVVAVAPLASTPVVFAATPPQVALLAGNGDVGDNAQPIAPDPVLDLSSSIDGEIDRMRNDAEIDVKRGFYSMALARYQGVARMLRSDIERLEMTIDDVAPSETERVRDRLGHRTAELVEVQAIVRLLGLE